MTTDLDQDIDIERRLRAAFDYRAGRTTVSVAPPLSPRSRSATGRSWAPLVGVAAATVVLVGGLLAMRAGTADDANPPAATQPVTSPDTVAPVVAPAGVAVDPLAIDLDAWQPLPDARVSGLTFLVLDTEQLPAGYALIDEDALRFLAVVGGGDQPQYAANARLLTAAGEEVFVAVETREFGPCESVEPTAEAGEAAIYIDDRPARLVSDSLCWNLDSGALASVRFGSSADDGADARVDRLADVARALRFIEVDRLPVSTRIERAPDAVNAAPDDPDFGGVLGGVEWSATVSDSTLRGMQVYVDGEASSGFENDRLSQPTDSPTGGGEVSIGGTPGAGAIVFGYVPSEAATLVVRGGSNEVIRLPLFRGDLESYFALPVPEGVIIESAEFVDESGVLIARLDLPDLPLDLGGTYGGVGTIRLV